MSVYPPALGFAASPQVAEQWHATSTQAPWYEQHPPSWYTPGGMAPLPGAQTPVVQAPLDPTKSLVAGNWEMSWLEARADWIWWDGTQGLGSHAREYIAYFAEKIII